MEMRRNVIILPAWATIIPWQGSKTFAEGVYVPVGPKGCNTWTYALDTWRIVPKKLTVNDSTVQLTWRIAEITPGAADEAFDGAVSVQLDNNPRVLDTIFSRARDSERLRMLKLTGLGPGQHHLTVGLLWNNGFTLGEFKSCFAVPQEQPINAWHDLGGEAWQSQ